MAAFFTNVCQWPSCGKKCSSLLELIDHVESTHIESDPVQIERWEQMAAASMNLQTSCTSLSYVNRFFSDAASDGRKHSNLLAEMGLSSGPPPTSSASAVAPSPKRKKSSSARKSAPPCPAPVETAREADDTENADSDDSGQDNITSDEIMKMMSLDGDPDKPFICPVQGCGKRYKNVNGMKYHARNGHKTEKKVKKLHQCACGKTYRSMSSLKQHQQAHHPGENVGSTTTTTTVTTLDSTMLAPATTSFASSLSSLAAQVSSAASSPVVTPSSSSTSSVSTRIPVSTGQPLPAKSRPSPPTKSRPSPPTKNRQSPALSSGSHAQSAARSPATSSATKAT